MKKQRLEQRLLCYFVLVAFLPVLTMMVYYFFTVRKDTLGRLETEYTQRAAYAMDKIEDKVTQVHELATWIFQNESIQQLLSAQPEAAAVYTDVTHTAVQDLLKQFSYRPITGDLLSLFLIGENGLDLRGGTEASLIDLERVLPMLASRENCDRYWGCLTDNLTSLTETPQVIFYRHPVMDAYTGAQSGWLVMLFSSRMFEEECADLLALEGNRVSLVNQSGGVLAGYGDSTGGRQLSYTATSLSLGWTLTAQVDDTALADQLHAAMQSAAATVLLICLLALLMAFYLSQNFTRPIAAIMKQVERISKGDFSHPALQKRAQLDEIGQLETQIADMGDSISRLLHEQLVREQEKRRLEVQMLQNQLNPHFLYHTLNSIKLMAALQGKSGIPNMIEALGRLLKANLSVRSEYVSLDEELDLLDSYIYIQNAAYKGKIRYDHPAVAEELRDCLVPRFLLQPLVENAILHGLAALPLGGSVRVTAARRGNRLHIRVADTGAGMTADALRTLRMQLAAGKAPGDGQTRGIGLRNLACRLGLLYGGKASLSVYSREGQGTWVNVSLPVQKKGGRPWTEH